MRRLTDSGQINPTTINGNRINIEPALADLPPRYSDDEQSIISGLTFTPISVSRAFRDALALEIPGLTNHKYYWRLLQYLCFGSWRDVSTGRLLLPQALTAAMEEKRCDQHYSARKFVDAFVRATEIQINLIDHKFSPLVDASRPRMIESVVIDPKVAALVEAERTNLDEDRVWMDTGVKWLRKHASDQRRQDEERAEGLLQIYQGCPQSVALAHYLNSLPANRFSSILTHIPEAMEAAKGMKDEQNQQNLLKAIRDQWKPIYGLSDKTTRVFATKDSILRLHRDLRKIVTQDWVTADLKSAQLAIVAKIWNVPEIEEYLRSGQSIWEDLCAHMGLEFSTENKAIVKTTLYSITFGAGREKMELLLSKDFDSGPAAYAKLKQHPVVSALLIARSRQLKEIRYNKGGTDAFGRFIPLEYFRKEGYEYDFDNSRSILACIAQSYELKLLLPVISLAMSNQFSDHGFCITTFLHDGFTFDSFKSSNTQKWMDEIAMLVKDEADELGIYTELEFG